MTGITNKKIGGMSLSDYQTEADARNLTASRLDAILRVADASSGQSTGLVDTNVTTRNAVTPPTAQAIEDEILNALTSGHVTVDTIGQALHMLRNAAIAGATANSIMARIDEAISAAKNIKRTTTNATYVHANVTTEEDVVEFIGLNNDVELNMDCILLTQNATVRVRERVDGITYEIIQEAVFPTDFDGEVISVGLRGKGRDMKVTLQSAVLEGVTRDIPHSRIEILTAV